MISQRNLCGAVVLLSVSGLFLLGGCQPRTDRAGSGDVVFFAEDAADLEALREAHRRAKEGLDPFIEALQNPAPGQQSFAVKARFTDQAADAPEDSMPNVEYMWVAVTVYENGVFHGTLDNTPDVLKDRYQKEQDVEVPRDWVHDWLYIENGRRQGGWSIDYLVRRAAEGETSQAPAESGDDR